MEAKEEDPRKKYGSLPSNYVSLAQLQERWLQQQQQKQEQEQQNQNQKQKQLEKVKRTNPMALKNQQQEKQKHRLYRNQRKSKDGERRVPDPRVYVPRRELDENPREICGHESELKSEKLKMGASGVKGADQMKKGKRGKKKKYYSRVEGSLIGVEGFKENSENLSRKSGREEGRDEEFERTDNGNWGVEEDLSLCMVDVVPENSGKEVNLVAMGGECGFNVGSSENISRNSDDCLGLEGSGCVCMVEVLPENELGEEVALAGNGDDPGIMEARNVFMEEVLPKNEVEEDVSVGVGSKMGEERFRGRYGRRGGNWGKGRVYRDSKVQLGMGETQVEEGVFASKNRKWRTRRGIQAFGGKEKVSGNLRPNVERDLRALSLDDSTEGNVTSRKGPQGGQRGRYGKLRGFGCRNAERSRDGDLVWVKKGEISDTNSVEI